MELVLGIGTTLSQGYTHVLRSGSSKWGFFCNLTLKSGQSLFGFHIIPQALSTTVRSSLKLLMTQSAVPVFRFHHLNVVSEWIPEVLIFSNVSGLLFPSYYSDYSYIFFVYLLFIFIWIPTAILCELWKSPDLHIAVDFTTQRLLISCSRWLSMEQPMPGNNKLWFMFINASIDNVHWLSSVWRGLLA